MAGLFDSWTRGVQVGRENRRQRVLGENLQGALGGDQSALSNVFGVDPDAGMRVQQFAAQQQKAQTDATAAAREDFGKLSVVMSRMKDTPQAAHVAAQWVKAGKSAGLLPQEAPEHYDPEMHLAAEQFASVYGGAKAPEPFTLGPGSKRFDASGRVIAEVPFAPPKQDFVLSPDGTQWLPKPTGMPQQPMGQPQGGDPFASLRSSIPDLRVTSQFRTPEENARMPNSVPNSFHLTGQAIDIGRPSPQQRQQINAWASQNGYEVIDNYRDGHVHLEPRDRPQASPQGAIPIPGATPRPSAQSDIERRIDLARAAGATEEEIKRMIIGREGAAAGAKPLPVGALRALLDVQDALGATQNVSAIIQKHAQRMQKGELDVYPEDSIGAKFRTAIGRTNTNDVNVNEWRADMTRIVNESLRLNKGVQTEGDAQRAVQELMAANDQKTAARALQRLAELNQRAVKLQRQKAALIRRNYGQDEEGNPLGAPQQAQPQQGGDVDSLLAKYGVQ